MRGVPDGNELKFDDRTINAARDFTTIIEKPRVHTSGLPQYLNPVTDLHVARLLLIDE